MSRLDEKRYQYHVMAAMLVYMVVLLAAFSLVRMVSGLPVKAALALAPVVPILWLIAVMWRRIHDSDELAQRVHLIALGVATAVTGAVTLVVGFLAAGDVIRLDGSVLIWVFPLLIATYGAARSVVAGRYGMDGACSEGSRLMPWYFVFFAALMVGGAAWAAWRHDEGGAAAFVVAAVVFAGAALRAWRRRACVQHRAGRDDA